MAIRLFAADPAGLGGIAVRAGAGPARDHYLALLGQALPPGSPVRRLPLHTGDERLLGGLDLAATLRSGRLVEQKGLLAEANGGVVVVAMAERVEPSVAARLCAVMDTGVVSVPRDGLSRCQPARFGVVALDEGIEPDEHTPPGLLDRLAFHVDLTGVALGQAAAPGQSEAGQEGPMTNSVPDHAIEALCSASAALGIESVRAPLLALRVARAAASWSGRTDLSAADIALAARLVLGPRAVCLPPVPEPEQQPEVDNAQEESESEDEAISDRPLEDVVLDAAHAALPADLLARLAAGSGGAARSRVSGRSGQIQASLHRGRPIGTRQGKPGGGARLHLLETLKAAIPWQKLRHRSRDGRIEVRPDDFRIVRFRRHTETTTVFAVDASGSAALHRLGEAKGAVELLLADCYVRRDRVALVSFRGQSASLLLPPTGSLLRAKRCLAGLPGGGGTPLAAGIDAAAALADAERRRGRTPVLVLLTDGRANIGRDGTGGRQQAEADAMASARLPRAAGLSALLVDTSPRANPFARRLAEAMGARYVPLPHADASTLSQAVRSAAAA